MCNIHVILMRCHVTKQVKNHKFNFYNITHKHTTHVHPHTQKVILVQKHVCLMSACVCDVGSVNVL